MVRAKVPIVTTPLPMSVHPDPLDGVLRVFVESDGALWMAQGLEIDYAACGTSVDDVINKFSEGFKLTIENCGALGLPRTVDADVLNRYQVAVLVVPWTQKAAPIKSAFPISRIVFAVSSSPGPDSGHYDQQQMWRHLSDRGCVGKRRPGKTFEVGKRKNIGLDMGEIQVFPVNVSCRLVDRLGRLYRDRPDIDAEVAAASK